MQQTSFWTEGLQLNEVQRHNFHFASHKIYTLFSFSLCTFPLHGLRLRFLKHPNFPDFSHHPLCHWGQTVQNPVLPHPTAPAFATRFVPRNPMNNLVPAQRMEQQKQKCWRGKCILTCLYSSWKLVRSSNSSWSSSSSWNRSYMQLNWRVSSSCTVAI